MQGPCNNGSTNSKKINRHRSSNKVTKTTKEIATKIAAATTTKIATTTKASAKDGKGVASVGRNNQEEAD